MKSKYLFLSLFLVLTHFTSHAQSAFFPGEIYIKLADDFPIALDQYPGDSINIAAQLPFFAPFVEAFHVGSVKQGFHFTSDNKLRRTFWVRCADGVNLDEFVTALDARPEVDYAEKIPVNLADYTPNDLGANTLAGQWNLHKIDAQTAWNSSQGNPSVVVAIVDNAFEITNNDLVGVVVAGWDASDNDNNPAAPNATFSHGTHVAGIAGAKTNNAGGIASIGFGISIMPVKATPDNGNPGYIYAGYQGIAWAAAHGAKVINCSWGSSSWSQTGQNTVNAAWNLGAVVVAAAGNSSNQTLHYPASFQNVVSVASTNINDQVSSFSTRNALVDVSAPGESIRSLIPFNSYAVWNGTSMAAPLVSGLLGLMLSANPNLTNVDLVNCLVSSTDNINAQNQALLGLFGSGRINANKALLCAKNSNPCPPSYVFGSPGDDMSVSLPTWEAQNYIEASNKITGSASITYDAATYILLKPGFYAASTKFLAVIEGCGGIFAKPEEPVDNRQSDVQIVPNPNTREGLQVRELQLFPNPANDYITISWESKAPQNIHLTDCLGRNLRTFEGLPDTDRQEVPLVGLPPGTYFLVWQSEIGERHSQAFVKM